MKKHIALLDDEPDFRSIYVSVLQTHEFEVSDFSNIESLNIFLKINPVDGFVLDICLPGQSDAGLILCQQLRTRYPLAPIIILSGISGVHDKISAYRMGADNYIVKSSGGGPDYLVAVLQAHLRRVSQIRQSDIRESESNYSKPLRVDSELDVVYWNNFPLRLSPQDVAIVKKLIQKPGHAVSHDALMDAAGIHVEPNTIAVAVRRIRNAFMEIDPDFEAIRTIRNKGYRWFDVDQ